MSDLLTEAISTDDSPAPKRRARRRPLLGDPRTEGNEHIFRAAPPSHTIDIFQDDIHAELANSDIQN